MSDYGDSFDSSASSSTTTPSSSLTSASSSQQESEKATSDTKELTSVVSPLAALPVPLPLPVPVAAPVPAPVVSPQPASGVSSEVTAANAPTLKPTDNLPTPDIAAAPREAVDSQEPPMRSPRNSTASKTLVNTSDSAYEAPGGDLAAADTVAYKRLTSYVAFNQSSDGSVAAECANTSSFSGKREASADDDTKVPKMDEPTGPVATLEENSETATAAGVEESSTVDGSSAFSTLSQHLSKTVTHAKLCAEMASVTKGPSDEVRTGGDGVMHPSGDGGGPMITANVPAAATTMLKPLMSLPPLPSAAESMTLKADFPLPSTSPSPDGLIPERIAFAAQSIQSMPTPPPLPPAPLSGIKSGMMPSLDNAPASSFYLPPPPLAQSREPPVNNKIVELRETSEAVEKLVRAFALLRGHNPTGSRGAVADISEVSFAPNELARMSSLRQEHGVGDSATIKTSQTPRRRPLRSSMPKTHVEKSDENQKASQQINEAAVEEAVLSLVMEMMQQDPQQMSKASSSRRFLQPACELIGMDDFRYSHHRSSKRQRGPRPQAAPLSVFGGGMQAFAPDDDGAAESLYNSVIEALGKYVWSHVEESSLRGERPTFPPVSAHCAIALQLDLLSVCLQVIETRLTHRGNVADGPVWIQYDGPRESEPLARNAAHCLPFESIDVKTSRRPVFRLEYWVTRENMWAVAEALVSSVRGGILDGGDGYGVFNAKSTTYVDPDTLFPTRVPYFSLLPGDSSRPPREECSPSPGKKFFTNTRRSDKDSEDEATDKPCAEHFHLEPPALQAIAHAVSTVGTEILEENINGARGDYKQNYGDATCAVVEAVRELLEDANIRAAVRRRAKAKMKDIAQRREVEGQLSREEKERSIIAAAEAEAEQVVQRILQELRVEEARNV
ncbi:hypothetical protein DPX39_030063800 [Trypanosoma brucei equiperdum]|uniref:Uncharacterized protein n=1 Tax=Trypanosoma brucei equiperdum TaxID=630700 RepID=A0A3L6LBV9_9TRYP|nr:hypothetical protein DPX39_030053800 [Trypanosoma brucei equiperdum]RHW73546.1 hypothetical protein DPX39_030058800 [Trypanosoma brucei equiperdum]RHW73824.1 hypothetical protein DPX39_030068800 [Trypanosoma brucei equiperdum]RHW73922.1 hypothetical protein DPX39_030063800 [Trypanosoma brucei equiperdum]